MKDKYIIFSENGVLENVMSRDEAIEKVKQYHEHGVDAYIVSETEGQRIKENQDEFERPKWE